MNLEHASNSSRDVWLCNAEVNIERSHFVYGPPPFLFVDIVHPTIDDPNSEEGVQVNQTFHNLRDNVTVGSSS